MSMIFNKDMHFFSLLLFKKILPQLNTDLYRVVFLYMGMNKTKIWFLDNIWGVNISGSHICIWTIRNPKCENGWCSSEHSPPRGPLQASSHTNVIVPASHLSWKPDIHIIIIHHKKTCVFHHHNKKTWRHLTERIYGGRSDKGRRIWPNMVWVRTWCMLIKGMDAMWRS